MVGRGAGAGTTVSSVLCARVRVYMGVHARTRMRMGVRVSVNMRVDECPA